MVCQFNSLAQSKTKAQHIIFNEDGDSGISSTEKSLDENISANRKKKKTKLIDQNVNNSSIEDSPSPTKKKKKSKEVCDEAMPTVVKQEVEEDPVDMQVNNQNSRKKKSKNSSFADGLNYALKKEPPSEVENSPAKEKKVSKDQILLSDFNESFSSKKKRKRESKEGTFCEQNGSELNLSDEELRIKKHKRKRT